MRRARWKVPAALLLALAGSMGCDSPTAAEAEEQGLHVNFSTTPPAQMRAGRFYHARVAILDRDDNVVGPGPVLTVRFLYRDANGTAPGAPRCSPEASCRIGVRTTSGELWTAPPEPRAGVGIERWTLAACIVTSDDQLVGCAEQAVEVHDLRIRLSVAPDGGRPGAPLQFEAQLFHADGNFREIPSALDARLWLPVTGSNGLVDPCDPSDFDSGRTSCAAGTTGGRAVFPPLVFPRTGVYTVRACWERPAGAPAYSDDACERAGPGQAVTISAVASRLRFRTQPGGAATGQALAQQPVVEIVDDDGQVVPSATDQVRLSLVSPPGVVGAGLGLGSVASAVNGVATFTNTTVFASDDGGAGFRLQADAPGLVSATSAPFDVAGLPLGGMTAITEDGHTATVGTPLGGGAAVRVTRSNGSPAAGVPVTFTVAAGGGSLTGASAVTDQNGVAAVGSWTLGTVAGENRLAATAGPFSVTISAIGQAGPPASLAKVEGDGLIAAAGLTLSVPPAVVVRDQYGNPVPLTPVTFAVASGGGSVTPATPVNTNAQGRAAATAWTLGATLGTNTLAATAGALSATFTATGIAGAPASIARAGGDGQSAVVGTAVAVAPSVLVADQFGNPVAGVAVTFAVAAGGGAVAPAVPVATNSSGIAAPDSWTLGAAAGANTLAATAAGLAGSPVAFTATGLPAAASRLVFATQPGGAVAGLPIAPAVVVEVQDGSGNRVTVFAGDITIALGANPAGGTLRGTVTRAAAGGVATFDDLALDRTGGGYALAASGSGLAGATSAEFAVATGAAAAIAAHEGMDQVGLTGRPVATPPAVRVTDAGGNPVTGVAVAFAVLSGGGVVTGPNATTGADGVARVGGWTLGSIGVNELTASAAGLAGSPVTFSARAGVPAQVPAALAFAQQPPASVASGAAMAPPLRVEVRDNAGALVAGSQLPVTIALADNPAGGTLAGTLTRNAVGGVATFDDLALDRAGTGYTLAATSPGLLGVVSTGITVTGGAAATIAAHAGDGQSAVVGTPVPVAPAVRVTDAAGNPVAGVAVTFAVAGGGGSVVGADATTGADGVAAAGSWTLGPAEGVNALTATAAGLAGSPVTYTATGTSAPEFGTATQIRFRSYFNPGLTVGTPFSPPIEVEVQDADGNVVTTSTAPVTLEIGTRGSNGGQPSAGALSGTLTRNAVNGVATFDDLSIDKVGEYGLRATSPGLQSPLNLSLFVRPGAAASLAAYEGDGQAAAPGSAVAVPPAVIARDALGNPVPGVQVAFAVASGGGSVTGAEQVTGPTGVARAGEWTLGPNAGANTLTAAAAGLAGSPVTFTATGTTTRYVFATQPPSRAVAGEIISPAVTVALQDAFGQPVVAPATVTLTLVDPSFGGATLLGTVTRQTVNGVATFDDLRIERTGQGYTLRAAGGSALAATSAAFDVRGGAPAALELVQGDGQSAPVGLTVEVPPMVRVLDRFGNGTGATLTLEVLTGGGQVSSGHVSAGGSNGVLTPGGNYNFDVRVEDFTDASGYADMLWMVGDTPGANTMRILVASNPALSVTLSATATAVPFAAAAFDAGSDFTCAVTASATAPPYCWGENDAGQVGDGTGTDRPRPTAIGAGFLSFRRVAAGDRFACGLTELGAAYCWGVNESGQLGTGDTVAVRTPALVQGGHRFSSISAGGHHACATTTVEGAVYCWGSNQHGQLGSGGDPRALEPRRAFAVTRAVEVSVGDAFSCARTAEGEVWCWGQNDSGQLGIGSNDDARLQPSQIAGGRSYVRVSAGANHACAITTTTLVYCWGLNASGQLGTGVFSATPERSPVPATGVLGNAREIAAGAFHTCAVTALGEAYCWGSNSFGQLGDGTTVPRATGVLVATVRVVFDRITAGGAHSCATRPNGMLYCWGANGGGQLGNGGFSATPLPVPVGEVDEP